MLPFSAPKDYPEMLNKIGVFTLVGTVTLTWIVAQANTKIGALLSAITVKVPFFGVELPVLYVAPGVLIATTFRAFKLHDRVSDLFSIREGFDLHEILVPLAKGVGLTTSPSRLQTFLDSRSSLMNRVFYRYVGSSDPVIPQHYITMALDSWAWVWIIAELEVVALVSVLLLLFSRAFTHAAAMLGLMVLGLLAMSPLRRACARHAHTEVEFILEDGSRRKEIKTAFNAL